MEWWQVLFWVLVGVGVIAALLGVDRFCLWLEAHGWLYYRHKKPSSSPASAWVALQQFVEPGVKHVIEVKDHQREQGDLGEEKDTFLRILLAIFKSTPVNPEEIRSCLAAARRAGVDWKMLYEEAAQAHRAVRPERSIPSLEEVAPGEDL
jgi:hypothetical protein